MPALLPKTADGASAGVRTSAAARLLVGTVELCAGESLAAQGPAHEAFARWAGLSGLSWAFRIRRGAPACSHGCSWSAPRRTEDESSSKPDRTDEPFRSRIVLASSCVRFLPVAHCASIDLEAGIRDATCAAGRSRRCAPWVAGKATVAQEHCDRCCAQHGPSVHPATFSRAVELPVR